MNEIKDETETATHTSESNAPTHAPTTAKTNGTSKKKAAVKTKGAKKAKPAKKTTSTQAQSGPAIKNLTFDKLNKAEQKIVKAVFTTARTPFAIKDIMKATKLKSSPVRNGLRRPVRGQWIEHGGGRGKYRVTKQALKRGIPGV